MRILAVAAVALALSACGGSEPKSDEANALTADNMVLEDDSLTLDSNAMNGTTGMDANASVNGSTENLMMKDATTNDPDTNLANGL